MKKEILVGIILTWTAGLTGFGMLSCSRGNHSGQVETVTVAVPPLEQNALLYVAESQKLFQHNALNVAVKDRDTGVTSINALLNGEADIAAAAEFPFVGVVCKKEPVRVIACYDRFANDYIVARKDRLIESISDLRGKRIGVALKTINDFYLGRILALNGLKMEDVTLVDVSPARFVSAIADGEVDAIIAWQPYISRIQEKLSGTVVWPAQSSQPVYGILVVRDEWLAHHTGTVERFLRSLKEAEDYLVNNPRKAMAIVRKRLGYGSEYIAEAWSQHQFALFLDFSLVIAMNDEARWMIYNHLVTEKTIPDFKNTLYLDGLRAVKPEAMNIIP